MVNTTATPQKHSDLVTDLFVGLSDGLIIPFALATGLYHADLTTNTILIVGMSWVVIGSLTVGLGSFWAGKNEIKSDLPDEVDSELKIASNIGLDEQTVQLIAEEAEKDKEEWEEMKSEYELEIADGKTVRRSSINIGVFYFLGGLIPLFPYMVQSADSAFKSSLVSTISALFLFGFFKGKATGRPAINTALRMTFVGCIMAGVAYFIAGLL